LDMKGNSLAATDFTTALSQIHLLWGIELFSPIYCSEISLI